MQTTSCAGRILKIRHSIGRASDIEYWTFYGRILDVEYLTFDVRPTGCRIFEIRRRPISDRKSNRIFLHTSTSHCTAWKKLCAVNPLVLVISMNANLVLTIEILKSTWLIYSTSILSTLTYQVWQKTDRSTLETEQADTDAFVEKLCTELKYLTPQAFCAKQQVLF